MFKFKDEAVKELNVKSLTVCCLLIAAVSGFMCVLNICTSNMRMAAITGCMALWYLVNVILFMFYKNRVHLVVSMMIGAYALMMYFVVTGGVDGFSFVWLLAVPPAVQYCFNSYYGIPFSLFIWLSMVIYMWTPLHKFGYPYSETYLMRFPIVYFFVTFLSAVMQYRISKYRSEQEALIDNLEYAGRTKNDFLANMSHEIRTPMNAIVGMCELILRDDINESVRENCFNIQNSGRSLLSIINDILNFSKIEAGKIDLVEEQFNLASTINDVINMAMTRKGDKNIEIIVRVDPTIPKGLIGDELRIRQVIINLLTNAVKFTQKGCVIVKISQSKHDYGINLNVSIKDTGIGITEENIERLFTSFQQVDTRKNRAVEGTGLGLAISKRLITKMGGFINVFSTYGKGSEFRFVVPLKVSDSEPFITINDATEAKVAVYLEWKKYDHPRTVRAYNNLIREMGDKFDIAFTIFDDIEALKQAVEEGKYTHCFTAKEEYLRNRETFGVLADACQILVVQDRFNTIELPENIKKVYKPFYALSFAAVMNNEKYVMDVHGHKVFTARFIAPEAKVLIVDDNAINLKVAAGLMKPYNMKIITVSSGPEAIEAIKTKDYDIVFMDHMMPGMDGVEATKIIRNMHGEYYCKVPVIALTANAVNGAREMFLSNGFNDFLPKPIETTVLDRMLRMWLPIERIITTSTLIKQEEETEQNVSKEKENLPRETYAGIINYDKGLMYTGGSKETYFDVMNMYINNSTQYRESLIARYKAEEWNNYTVEVHALKSSSLSIGAEVLSELAKKLEFAGKESRYEVIYEEHTKLIGLYDEVVANAKQYLKDNGYVTEQSKEVKAQDLKNISIEEFMEYIVRITEACDNFDGDEVIAVADELISCKVNDKILAIYFDEIKKYADDYDYDKALELIQKTVAEVKGEEQ